MLVEGAVKQEIEDYLTPIVDSVIHNSKESYIIKSKVIHDAVHGTSKFDPFEIAIIDLPIIQRLRRISQTDVSSYVFPAGNHNRFEHTIGVATVAEKMVNAIYSKPLINKRTSLAREWVMKHARVAALLHDCGHGPFSHLSESVYGCQFDEIKRNPRFAGASPHEILSYLITTSPAMHRFNKEVIDKLYNVRIDLDFVGDMIIGYVDKEKSRDKGFVVELINGSFDADKLDYILRDAHSTGIQLAVDLSRLMYTLDVAVKDSITRLVVDISGVSAIEEIVFNKMLLTSAIYQHQKVRATACLIKRIFICSGKFKSVMDYVKLTDDQVVNIETKNVEKYIIMLKNRNIPKRAFCFSTRTLEDKTKLASMIENFRDPKITKRIIRVISKVAFEEYGIQVPVDEIWIDSPKEPKFKEATQCCIKDDAAETGLIDFREVFPTDDWARAFLENKWKGFVFTMPEYVSPVSRATKKVFEECFSVKFNNFATKICKIE